MIQLPKSLSLMLCDQVIFEIGTQKPSLVGVFTGLACHAFPSTPRPFDVFAALTDGQGEGEFKLVVTNLGNDALIAEQTVSLSFSDPLTVVNFRFRFRTLSFPEAGTYMFELNCEDETICHRRIRVYGIEGTL